VRGGDEGADAAAAGPGGADGLPAWSFGGLGAEISTIARGTPHIPSAVERPSIRRDRVGTLIVLCRRCASASLGPNAVDDPGRPPRAGSLPWPPSPRRLSSSLFSPLSSITLHCCPLWELDLARGRIGAPLLEYRTVKACQSDAIERSLSEFGSSRAILRRRGRRIRTIRSHRRPSVGTEITLMGS